MKVLSFPFRSLWLLIGCLIDALAEWREISIAMWRYVTLDPGRCKNWNEYLDELDEAAPKLKIGDQVHWWQEVMGVIEGVDGGIYTVRILSTEKPRGLRAHEMEIMNEV